MNYPIRIVRGNWVRLHHPLEKVVWAESNKTIVDYVPQEGDKLTVTLQGAYKPYTMENVTIEGNVLKYENNGTLPCGVYDVVINVVLADGKRLRSHQDGIVKVVKTNKEASIPDYVEFGIDTYELDGAVFMYVPSEGGSGDMSNYYTKDEADARYLQDESDPTVPAWAKQPTKPTYTAQEVGALPANTPIPSASDTTPSMDGVGSAGSATTFARADHRHPSDTTKQDVINDLADIRSGASKGATAYQKPSTGIPKTDLAQAVKTSLEKADSALQSHQDISGKVNTSDLSNVAFSGDYDDLDNKPTIPAAGDVNVIEEVQVNGVALNPDSNKAVNVQVPTNNNQLTNGAGYITSADIANKEDKFTIVANNKTSGFEASVGNYYFVDIAASGSVSIQLATPTDNTKLSSCVFFLTTNTSPALNFAAETGVPVYYAANYKIEANKVYEINALYNGESWCIAQVEMEVTT